MPRQSSTAEVQYKVEEGIATISFNRPHVLNALTKEMIYQTNAVILKADADERVRVIVLTGTGRAFCAGEDLKEDLHENRPLKFREKILEYQKLTKNMRNSLKVVIAAVNGYALGGGCEIALSCDLIIASKKALFAFPETHVGQLITNSGLYRLPRLVGEKKAKEIAILGEMIPAEDAERIGMINRAVPAAKLIPTVKEIATKIMRNAPMSVAMTKKFMDNAEDMSFDGTMELETQGITTLFSSEDRVEGARAFAEKRPPRFRGA